MRSLPTRQRAILPTRQRAMLFFCQSIPVSSALGGRRESVVSYVVWSSYLCCCFFGRYN